MNNVFAAQVEAAARQGLVLANTRKSWNWLRQNYESVNKRAGSFSAIKSSTEERERPTIGRMYHFKYDPKTKDRMPFWDTFPLVIPVEPAEGGFYGINFHYLPLRERALLMDRLYEFANNDKMDRTTKIRVSYSLLKQSARLKLFQPAFKRYLFSQMRSRFLYIDPSDWMAALFIPSERFEGATKQKVWTERRSDDQPIQH
jgi:hypothetical protein